jgi:hypothetical protein
MNIEIDHILCVTNLKVQTTMGSYLYSGKVRITDVKKKGTVSPLKIKMGNIKQQPVIIPDDYFVFLVLDGRGTNGTSSRTQLESGYVPGTLILKA